MSTSNYVVFSAIEDFVKSLEESFPSNDKKNPLHLYSKMIDIIKKEQNVDLKTASYEKAIGGFRKYFTSTGSTGIYYGTSSNVYIPIGRFLKTDSATREVINSHLTNIRTLLGISPGTTGGDGPGISNIFKDALGEDANTEDGIALQKVAEKIGNVVQNMSSESHADPMAAIGALMADNSIEEMMQMFNGKMNNKLVKKLFNSIIEKALPDDAPESTLTIEPAPETSGTVELQGVEKVSETENISDDANSLKAETGSDS